MTALALRDQSYIVEHQESSARRAERGKMPKTLTGLVRWFVPALSDELPERLHIHEPWRDQVTAHERQNGTYPTGGSRLGSLAYAGSFRLMLEAGASITDEDGYYLFPIRAALSRLYRRKPLMARFLFSLGLAEGDWRSVATSLGYPLEMMEVYTEGALRALWMETWDRTSRMT